MEGGIVIKRLDNNELSKIKGGFVVNAWVVLGGAALLVFLSGIIDGIANPDRCRS